MSALPSAAAGTGPLTAEDWSPWLDQMAIEDFRKLLLMSSRPHELYRHLREILHLTIVSFSNLELGSLGLGPSQQQIHDSSLEFLRHLAQSTFWQDLDILCQDRSRVPLAFLFSIEYLQFQYAQSPSHDDPFSEAVERMFLRLLKNEDPETQLMTLLHFDGLTHHEISLLFQTQPNRVDAIISEHKKKWREGIGP